jgi:putative ABC transport system substrate-binding protein
MLDVGDPVGAGLVANLARPGGNVTGTSLMLLETQGKNLELLKEAVPTLKRLAVLHTNDRWFTLATAAAERLGIETRTLVVRSADDLQRRSDAIIDTEAIWVLADPFLDELRGPIADFAIRHRLPSMGPLHLYAEAGFLFSYSANVTTLHGRGAYYVDRILKGARAGDLPIEQPTKFEFIVNLRTARELGFNIAPSLLVRADRVIE